MNIILDKIYSELKRLKKVTSKGDFADKLQYNRTYMSELMNSEAKEIPEKLQVSLQTVFGIHPKFTQSGEGKMFIEGTGAAYEIAQNIAHPPPANLTEYLLMDKLTSMQKELETLKKEVSKLKDKNVKD